MCGSRGARVWYEWVLELLHRRADPGMIRIRCEGVAVETTVDYNTKRDGGRVKSRIAFTSLATVVI